MSTLKRYNGTNWETIGGSITGDTLPIGSEIDYTGSSVPAGWEEVADYSTNEINTGKKWIDGKPIYRKVYSGNTPSSSGALFSTSGMNINEITKEEMLVTGSNGHVSVIGIGFDYSIPLNGSGYYSSTALLGRPCILILEYTKTTD